MTKDPKIGVVGCGYWGPNIIRNLDQMGHLVSICDSDEVALARVSSNHPGVNGYTDYREMLGSGLDAVCIVTPPHTHLDLTVQAMEQGKHVFIEKPLTMDVDGSRSLVGAAEDSGLVAMVGHTFVYNPSYGKVRYLVQAGEIGDLMAIRANRLNLGKFQESGVIWDLMPHDLSMVLDLLGGEMPSSISAEAYSVHPDHNVLDDAKATLVFPNPNGGKPIIASIASSWIYPHKTRDFSVIGTRGTLFFDDVASPRERVKLYRDGAERPQDGSTAAFDFAYAYGDITSYAIGGAEPLRAELGHFVDCIKSGDRPITDVESGLKVVTLLEEIERQSKL